MIQLYCGDGKGKTTAAVGAAVRAAGSGRRVLFAQLMKGRRTGEIGLLSERCGVTVLRSERAFPFFADMTRSQKKELTEIHDRMLGRIDTALQSGEADFVVLDEVTHACRYGLLAPDKLERILMRGKSAEIEIVLTGRAAPPHLYDVSDYISEIQNIRHPYADGVKAREGIER